MTLRIETPPEKWATFTAEYLHVRDAEGRFFSDEDARTLPKLPAHHPLKKEFDERAKTLRLLLKLLKSERPILDLGCGNGWMSNQLAHAGHTILGVDVNLPELEQATRLFESKNVHFAFADIFEWQPNQPVETILVSSALQYFPAPKLLFDQLFTIFPQAKNVIVCDTPFYSAPEIAAAKERTKRYYATHEKSNMAVHYFHHSLDNLGHSWHYLYKPYVSIINRILGGPQFPIIEIRRNI